MPLSMRDWRVCLSLPSKHHFELLPACFTVISFLGINVEGFHIIYSPGIEDFPALYCQGELKLNLGTSPWEFGQDSMVIGMGIVDRCGEKCIWRCLRGMYRGN